MGCVCKGKIKVKQYRVNAVEEEKQAQEPPRFHSIEKIGSPATSFYITIKDQFLRSNNTDLFFSYNSHNLHAVLEKQIEEFNWGEDEEFILQKISTDLLGMSKIHEYSRELFKNFKEFLKEETAHFISNRNQRDHIYSTRQLPFPLDLVWMLAFSSYHNYKELSESLIGDVLCRTEEGQFWDCKLYNFNQEDWETDKNSTLWVSHSQFIQILEIAKIKIERVKKTTLHDIKDIVQCCKSKIYKKRIVIRRGVPKPNHHPFWNSKHCCLPDLELSIDKELKSILHNLANALIRHLVHDKSFIAEVVVEYKRFLIMQYFSRVHICPSPLVECAWLMHIGYFDHYTEFSARVFGHVLTYSKNLHGNYSDTLSFYRYIFGQEPDPSIWPEPSEIIGYKWVSVLRVTRMIQEFSSENPEVLMNFDLERFVLEQYPDYILGKYNIRNPPEKSRKSVVRFSVSDEENFKSIY